MSPQYKDLHNGYFRNYLVLNLGKPTEQEQPVPVEAKELADEVLDKISPPPPMENSGDVAVSGCCLPAEIASNSFVGKFCWLWLEVVRRRLLPTEVMYLKK
jgi:hypothetical protein